MHLRFWRNLLLLGVGAEVAFCSCSALMAYQLKDSRFLAERARSTLLLLDEAPVSEKLVPWKKHAPRIRNDERACVQSLISLLTFDLHPAVFRHLTAHVRMSDPMVMFEGICEMRDAWWFLSNFVDVMGEPEVLNVARGQDGELFVDLETPLRFRILPLYRCKFSSTVKLNLIQTPKINRRRIAEIEHHFWGGPIAGTGSYPMNVLGLFADGVRRSNGYVLSLMSTYSSTATATVIQSAEDAGSAPNS